MMKFTSARKGMPAIDYVSIVSSLFADRMSVISGAAASAVAALAGAVKTGSPILALIAFAFVLLGYARVLLIGAFERARVAPDDADAAEAWELRISMATLGTAALYGIWCFIAVVVVDDGFAELSAMMVSIAVLIGLIGRNFAQDMIVALGSLLVAVPMAAGLFLVGDVYHALLALTLLPFVFSIRRMAAYIRGILLAAVHGRVEASNLAVQRDTALVTMPHGLCMLDSDGRVSVINAQAAQMLVGGPVERCAGRPFAEVIDEARGEGRISDYVADELQIAVAAGNPAKLVVELLDGSHCEVTVNAEIGRTVLMFEDITERVRANERINFMARYDGMTRLPNRAHFSDLVQAELAALRALGANADVALMIVDIDDFSHVNDSFGHLIGDQLLIQVADRIRRVMGSKAHLCRFGGDEFIVFRAAGVRDEVVRQDAETLQAALRRPFEIAGQSLAVNSTIGVVVAPATEIDLEMLLTRADLALYSAKAAGKAQWRLFHEDMDIEYRHLQRLKADLARAVDNDEIYLVYQPIVDIKSRRIAACEALARWRHRELGVIPPNVFIPIAEEIGAMSRISAHVLATATAECLNWPETIAVAVNISATDFRNVDVEQMVMTALEVSGLSPDRLIIEVTEGAVVNEQAEAAAALSSLRQRGVEIALDDFGTGYSSLSYLRTLPFTLLKIDRAFVADIETSQRSQRLLENIARLSKDLDMTVTVEGVETEEQLAVISRTIGVDRAQGFLFGPPLPQREAAELIAHVARSAATFPIRKAATQ